MVKSTRLTQTGHGPLIGPPKSSNHAGFDLRVLNVNQYRRNGPSRAAADCLAMLGILAKAARKSPEFARRKANSDRSFCFGLVGTSLPCKLMTLTGEETAMLRRLSAILAAVVVG